jgi:HK97 family phage portal protein
MKWPWQSAAPIETKDNSTSWFLSLLSAGVNASGISVTPETCEQSPTVKAIVTAISRRISVTPVHVYLSTLVDGRQNKERLDKHPVERLLMSPNENQSQAEYWSDAASSLVRYGNYVAIKGQGVTGPIRVLDPVRAGDVSVEQDRSTRALTYRYNSTGYSRRRVHHVRGPARNYIWGDSTIADCDQAIGMEIAAEQFGASFFGNGAMPSIYFKLMEGFRGFKTDEEQIAFLTDFKNKFTGKKRFDTMMLPKGMDLGTVAVENEKAQFIETRKLVRTVIAGAFGVPPHLVGDLERATFNNVEQQDADFTINVILPFVKLFESAMERDLLTQDDRNAGVIIRFNLDAIQRADFATRQAGNALRRQWGAISVNEWRETDGQNPISGQDGGDDYIRPMNMTVAGDPQPKAPNESNPNNPVGAQVPLK